MDLLAPDGRTRSVRKCNKDCHNVRRFGDNYCHSLCWHLNLGLVHPSLVLVKLTIVATHVTTVRKITIMTWVSSTSCCQNACSRAVHTILKYNPRKDSMEA